MGQYHYVVNVTKREFLHPHKLGDGLKLLEFGCSGHGTMAALALLLSEDGKGLGGGDPRAALNLVGRWARDTIVIAGDYGGPHGLELTADDKLSLCKKMEAEDGHVIEATDVESKTTESSLYGLCSCGFFKDISDEMRAALTANGVELDAPLGAK